MKVLFLVKDVLDFHQDLVCHGLAEVLGPENVLVYPHVERYHMPAPDGLKHNAMSYPNLPRSNDATFEELAAEADAVVVGCLRGTALEGLRQLVRLGVDKPRAALDGLDDWYVRGAIRHVDVYFKRETLVHSARLRAKFPFRRIYYTFKPHTYWTDEFREQVAVAHAGIEKLVPLPFGVVPIPYPEAATREYDIAFLGSATHPVRGQIVEELRALRAEGLRVLIPDDPLTDEDRYRFDSRLSWSAYMEALASSRIAISVRGNGFDTYRYWEIPYAGALLLAETPRTVIPDNFADGAEAVFAEPGRLTAEARRLLADDGLESIAAAGHAKLLDRHLSRHRAETVLERLAAV
jgi:hypothetical protein